MMKKHTVIYVFVMLGWLGCGKNTKQHDTAEQADAVVTEEPHVPQTTTFYETELGDSNAYVAADTMIYDVVIKNADPTDTWAEERLRHIDRKTLADLVFKAVYDGRLKAYSYNNGEEMTIADVKALEKEYSRKRIAKVQFIEEWYLQPKTMKMSKVVNSIMLAYENYNTDGEVNSYKAGIVVPLRTTSDTTIVP